MAFGAGGGISFTLLRNLHACCFEGAGDLTYTLVGTPNFTAPEVLLQTLWPEP